MEKERRAMMCTNYAYEITPDDSNDLPREIVSFRVGLTAGAVRVKTAEDDDVTIPGVQIGETIQLRVKRIYATGTTAAGITGFHNGLPARSGQ
jgi:hypothetical protein